jgi:hypothetical protein
MNSKLLGLDSNIIKNMDVDYNEKIFENMLEFIADLDPEALSDDQLEKILGIIEDLEISDEEDEVSEVRRKRVIRGGKKRRKVICRPGYRAVDGRCVRMKSAEKLKRKKGAIRAARKRKTKKTQIKRSRKISMRRRKSQIGSQ